MRIVEIEMPELGSGVKTHRIPVTATVTATGLLNGRYVAWVVVDESLPTAAVNFVAVQTHQRFPDGYRLVGTVMAGGRVLHFISDTAGKG